MSNFFDKEKYGLNYENLKLYFKVRIKCEKNCCVLVFNQSQWLTQYIEFNKEKKIEAEKSGQKDGKALYKLMNNAGYVKTMENLRNWIHAKLVNNKNNYLKWPSKPSYISQKIFDNDLVMIHKSEYSINKTFRFITWTYKPAYFGMCILDLSEVLL